VIIDKTGVVRYIGGFATWEELDDQIKSIEKSKGG
jgi:hypothetical protein